MMNEKMNEVNEMIVPLSDEELEEVTGGKHRYIEGDTGKS
jgi:bacteriocin-like protein